MVGQIQSDFHDRHGFLRFSDSADDPGNDLAQRRQIGYRERAHDAHDESLLDGCEDGFEYGRLDESGGLPVGDMRFTETERRAHLARDRHDDQIVPAGVVVAAGNNDGRALLGARLVGERKRDQHHIAEGMGHRHIRS